MKAKPKRRGRLVPFRADCPHCGHYMYPGEMCTCDGAVAEEQKRTSLLEQEGPKQTKPPFDYEKQGSSKPNITRPVKFWKWLTRRMPCDCITTNSAEIIVDDIESAPVGTILHIRVTPTQREVH